MTINDCPPLWFAIDTGLNHTIVMDKWAADALALRRVPGNNKLGAGYNLDKLAPFSATLRARDGSLLSFKFAYAYTTEMKGMPKDYADRRIAGAIGTPVLEGFKIMFDFEERTLTLSRESSRVLGRSSTAIRLREEEGSYFISVLPLKREPVELLLDTGSTETTFPVKTLSRLRPIGTARFVHWSADMERVVEAALLQSISIGEFREPEIGVIPEADDSTAVLGLNVLARFRIVLDLAGRRLHLERGANYDDQRRLEGDTGLVIGRTGDQTIVESIHRNSAGEVAGFLLGDRIVAVDGHAAGSSTIPVLQRLLDGVEGTRAKIEVDRNGKLLILEINRRRLYSVSSVNGKP
jgi:hypothetical protein